MGEIKKSTVVREALKTVLGKERYSDLTGFIYTDQRAGGRVRVKVQDSYAGVLTEDEAAQVTAYIQERYDLPVEVKAGRSGSRMYHFTAFTL